jgi:glycosyltransferase involved in cell wall biosynthesis
MPCFNEETFVADALQKVVMVLLDGNVEKEIIIVNDCSTDGTKPTIERFIAQNPAQKIKLVNHKITRVKELVFEQGFNTLPVKC